MIRRSVRFVLVAAAVLLLALAQPLAATTDGHVTIDVTPSTSAVEVGGDFTLEIVVTNTGDTETSALAVHLDITDPTGVGSVDPEDWSSTLTRQIGTLAPGAVRTISWDVKPISGGDFRAYVVVLPEAPGTDIWTSDGIALVVNEQRSINPEGVLPVVVAAPAVIGLGLISRLRRRR